MPRQRPRRASCGRSCRVTTKDCFCSDCAFEHFYGHLRCKNCIEELQLIWRLQYDRLCSTGSNFCPCCVQALLQHIDSLQERLHCVHCQASNTVELDKQQPRRASQTTAGSLDRADGCEEASLLPESGAAEVAVEENTGERAVCVICLDGTATLVGKFCGHMVWCRKCRRQAVHDQLGRQGSKRELSSRVLTRTKLPCPMCRMETCVVAVDKAEGQVFVPSVE